MRNILILIALVWAAAGAHADLLKLKPGEKVLEGVPLAVSAESAGVTMPAVAAGLRKKYVAWGVAVYVLQIFGNDPAGVVKTPNDNEMLDSFGTQSDIAVRMDFVRSVDVDTIHSGFLKGLNENGADVNRPALVAFLNAVRAAGPASNGSSMSFYFHRQSSQSDRMMFETLSGQTVVVEGERLAHDILSMWLGRVSPNDKGLVELRATLTGN